MNEYVRQQEEMMPHNILLYKTRLIIKESEEIKNFKFYNCIFNHEKGEYDVSKPHKHEVKLAWKHVFKGFCFLSTDGLFLANCNEENFDKDSDDTGN